MNAITENDSSENISSVLKNHITGMAHVGYIVDDLAQAIIDFKHIYGVDDSNIVVFPDFAQTGLEVFTRFAFIDVNGTEFELIEPISEQYKQLLHSAPSGGGGINHVAWRVDDIDACVALLADKGIKPGYVTPDGVIDMGSKKMVYLDPNTSANLYIELIEIKQG